MTAMLDPLASYSFFVDITGVTVAQFKEVTGLGISVGIVENRANQVGGQPVLQKMPGSIKYDDIHLSRGKVSDPAFWTWMKTVQEGKVSEARKDGSIILYDYAHGEVTRYNFFDAWPSRVEIGKLTAGADTVLLETVVLTIGRLEVK
jgi:phage tail-like protein